MSTSPEPSDLERLAADLLDRAPDNLDALPVLGREQ
jgi:hypothetical protein